MLFKTSASVFHERGVTYDLNGNIKTLLRTDSKGANMDSLTYKYGYNDTRSNMLRRVKDSGTTEGFADGSNYDDDYAYDSNGNMIVDKNKNITSITYNYLNLPEKVTKSTGEYIVYTYDASGRKLVQDVYNSSNVITKRSDYRGEWFLENDTLRFVNHEEGRAVVEGEWVGAPQLLTNPTMNTFVTGAYNGTNGATLSTQTIGSETYMKVTSNNTASTGASTGVAQYLAVKPGMKYTLRVRGYKTSTKPVALFVNGYGPAVNNSIVYPGPDLPNGSSSEGWIQSTFTVPTYLDHINVIMMWRSGVNTGDVFYLNDMELYEYHPGHGNQVFADAGYTYQYHLKDHLGNVRMTFTTKDEVDSATATLEENHINEDASNFLNYSKARRINNPYFDHTYNHSTPPNGTTHAVRLNGSANEKIGLAKSLSVMPGDTLKIEVFAKYYEPESQSNLGAFATFMAAIISNMQPAGTFIDGVGYGGNAATTVPYSNLPGKGQEGGTPPKAYLNWLVFDRDYQIVLDQSGYKRITTEAKEDTTNIEHERIAPDHDIVIGQPGYVYIYLSNENEMPVEVYFDDFKVEHIKSPVIESQSYYPFGLTFENYQRENSLSNQIKFQGQEHQDELGVNWDSFKWRNHQPDIGRFFNVDPLAEKYVYNSPYAFSENHVTSHGELEGLEKVKVTTAEFIANEKGSTVNTGGQLSTDKNVYNRNFHEAPDGGDYKESKSEVETSNGKVLSTDLWEQGDGPVEEFVDMFTGDPNNFDNSLSGQDTKGGSKLEGNIEGAKFNVDININKDVMTFTTSMSGGDKNKAYSLKMGEGGAAGASFVVGSLKSGREKGTTNTTSISIKFTVDKDGNAKFDFSQKQDLNEKDKNRSTSNEKK